MRRPFGECLEGSRTLDNGREKRTAKRLSDAIVRAPAIIGAGLAIPHHGAIGENDLIDATDQVAVLGFEHVNGNGIAGLQRGSIPAHQFDGGGASQLGGPVRDRAFIVLGIEEITV